MLSCTRTQALRLPQIQGVQSGCKGQCDLKCSRAWPACLQQKAWSGMRKAGACQAAGKYMLHARARRHTHRSASSQHVRQQSAVHWVDLSRSGRAAVMQSAAIAERQGSSVHTAISLLSCSMMRVHTLVLPLAVPPATPAHIEACCRCQFTTAAGGRDRPSAHPCSWCSY